MAETTYYVRSTVLGGEVMEELDSSGARLKTYVRLGTRAVAERVGGSVTWLHADPVTGSRGRSYPDGTYEASAEPDAEGINLGVEDPAGGGGTRPYSPELWMASVTAAGAGSPQCTLSGLVVDCEAVGNLMASGAALPSSLEHLQRRPGFEFRPLGLGLYRSYVPDERTLSDQIAGNDDVGDEGEVVRVNTDVPAGTWRTFRVPSFAPQKSGPCITQAVQGNRQLSPTRDFILSADGTFVSHDGWHVVAPPGTEVTTLEALQGEVLGVRIQESRGGKPILWSVDVLVNGGVAIYKDLQNPAHLRTGQQLTTGMLIGRIGISGHSQGLHFTVLRGGRTERIAYRKITSAISSLAAQIDSAYETGKSDAFIQKLVNKQNALYRQLTPSRFYTNLGDTPVGNCP